MKLREAREPTISHRPRAKSKERRNDVVGRIKDKGQAID
jgi:hypothetical protein